MNTSVIHRVPSTDEYNTLRQLVGWPVFEPHLVELVEEGLGRSLFAVCVENDGKIVGMGRIVGDNAIYLHIQDVIVHPDFQRRGIGELIMNDLMLYVQKSGGANTNIGLMCSKGREAFYKRYGFIERPAKNYGAGMIQVKP